MSQCSVAANNFLALEGLGVGENVRSMGPVPLYESDC
jgi:hypothetical protein